MPKNHSAIELRDWVVAAQSGDKEAFSEVVKRCQDMAYGIAYAMIGDTGLAQDAAQEAFVAAYLNLAALREPAAFPGWFRRVVIKHSDRERRSLKPSHPLDESTELSTTVPDPMKTLEASENRSEIHKAIAELPVIQKQIITLFYLRDYSQKEIEDFLELPVSTIKKHLFTARKKLKGRLETMVETQIQSNRPSQSGAFAGEVQYLLALRTSDLEGFTAMVEQQPDLLEMRFKIPVTRERHYWPLGGTPIHWAVVTGDEDERANRLDQFLTQPFHWTEPWTNLPGAHVSLIETLEGCRAILKGECDDMPEEAFYFIGNLEAGREKAKASSGSADQEISPLTFAVTGQENEREFQVRN